MLIYYTKLYLIKNDVSHEKLFEKQLLSYFSEDLESNTMPHDAHNCLTTFCINRIVSNNVINTRVIFIFFNF